MNLTAEVRHFNNTAHLGGSKACELEHFEIYKQLEAGELKYYVSEWVAPVPFEPKKNEHLSFRVYYQ